MTIHFPEKPEIKLGKAPLTEVICQLKFPAILRISKDIPAEFQESVREYFPVLKVEQGIVVQFQNPASQEAPAMETLPKVYRFTSSDDQNELALAPDFLALITRRYTHWPEFLKNLALATEALTQHYQPPFATRLGLRFVNRLTLQNTGCDSWQQMLGLLRPELTVLQKTDGWTEPIDMLTQILLQDEQGKLAMRTGSGLEHDQAFFLLDFDYFEEGQVSLENLLERLERYHARLYSAFRWCMQDEALQRFAPLTE